MAGGATPRTEDVAATTIETAPGEDNAEVTAGV